MRRLVTLLSVMTGIVFALPGLVLVTWAAARLINIQWAFNLALWAATYSPVPLSLPPVELANYLIEGQWWVFAALGGGFILALGLSILADELKPKRDADESHDGKARIELKTTSPCVGGPLEGTLRLTRDAKPGDAFVVELSCRRSSTGESRTETPFLEEKRVEAVRAAHGWGLPFRFEIPLTAPESNARQTSRSQGFQWQLSLRPADAWYATRSRFDLALGPAPEKELEAFDAKETPEQRQTVAALDALTPLMGRGKLLPHEREHLRSLSPQELEMARKVSAMPMKILKWGFIVWLVLFAGMGLMYYLMLAVAKFACWMKLAECVGF
jgi:hypothetical protein